jgi:hypothetical protein
VDYCLVRKCTAALWWVKMTLARVGREQRGTKKATTGGGVSNGIFWLAATKSWFFDLLELAGIRGGCGSCDLLMLASDFELLFLSVAVRARRMCLR